MHCKRVEGVETLDSRCEWLHPCWKQPEEGSARGGGGGAQEMSGHRRRLQSLGCGLVTSVGWSLHKGAALHLKT